MTQAEKERLLTLFASKSAWCQRFEARDARGVAVRYNDEHAVAWDVVGGMCLLFGWERASELFEQTGRQIAGAKRGAGLRNHAIAAMATLLDFNDRYDTSYDLIMSRLRNLRVHCQRTPSVARHECGEAQPAPASMLCS